MLAAAHDLATLLVGRFIIGIGIGEMVMEKEEW